ncbi:MAG: 50S ribosomal protein L11 methyltransferase [Oligoflexales bacterium]
MNLETTYELTIKVQSQPASDTKELVKAFLIEIGENTFVEGFVDNLDVDFDHNNPDRDFYEEFKNDDSPLTIYKYSRPALEQIKSSLEKKFPNEVTCSIGNLSTKEWQEGWKDSFKPIVTSRFFIHPSWEPVTKESAGKIPVQIDPGMAFGTGQHETTMLCLQDIEKIAEQSKGSRLNLLDVGTGSGILAICADKLGFKDIWATDIDPDALVVCKENGAINNVTLNMALGSVPYELKKESFDVVIANILAVVLRKMMDDLVATVKKGGQLVISGILEEDVEEFRELGERLGAPTVSAQKRNGWAAVRFQKK